MHTKHLSILGQADRFANNLLGLISEKALVTETLCAPVEALCLVQLPNSSAEPVRPEAAGARAHRGQRPARGPRLRVPSPPAAPGGPLPAAGRRVGPRACPYARLAPSRTCSRLSSRHLFALLIYMHMSESK